MAQNRFGMDEEQAPDREPWELTEPNEGYDVYDYDARRAWRGFRVVISVFIVAAILLGLMIWLDSRKPGKPRNGPLPVSPRQGIG